MLVIHQSVKHFFFKTNKNKSVVSICHWNCHGC